MDKKKEDNKNNRSEKQFNQRVGSSFIHKIKSNRLFQMFQHKEAKRYTTVIVSAVVIGIILGVTTLKILNHVGQPNDVGAIKSHVSDEVDDDKVEDITNQTIPILQAYVIQGGVFSNEDNLTEWKSRFHNEGYEVVAWERDELYYLLLGLATTESELSKLKEELATKDLEAYVKVWETAEYELDLDTKDMDWLNSFISLWKSSVENIAENNEFQEEDWNRLISSDNDVSDQLKSMMNEVDVVFNESGQDSITEQRYILLKIWYLFEDFILSEVS